MSNTLKILLTVLTVLMALMGCRKDPSTSSGYCTTCPIYIPQEVKDYMYFLPGTYWIYEEENSGELDSVYVTLSYNTIDSSGERVYEGFRVETMSDRDGYSYDYTIHTSFSTQCNPNIENCFRVNRIKYRPNDYVGETWAFFFDFFIGDGGYAAYSSSLGWVTLSDTMNSIQVSSNTFQNVVKYHDTKNITESDNETNFFVANNIGIVRKELLDSNKVWNLIRYNIVQ